MKPPYEINTKILKLVTSISEKIGEVNASFLVKSSPSLRKQNQIKTIHSSLKIEGNTLTEQQITAILENKRVIGPEKDIKEVHNAIKVYEQIENFKFDSLNSFLDAHKTLMDGLISDPGVFRKEGVGIVKGSKIEHMAPPAQNVRYLMSDLFKYLKSDDEITLVKSCVFHYEMEFIHPFTDGNGRMGRLWQTIILMSKYPVFQFIPFETLISETQEDYYNVLSICDKTGKSTLFIEYMLSVVNDALEALLNNTVSIIMNQDDRLKHFYSLNINSFTRKDYMQVFKHLSSASASRDLKAGLEIGLFTKSGDKRLTTYHLKE
ncbi:Fic family protein [Luteibaculum oceani]|uniref:Fic family protein n=1 Tax=Luteibaculum oceani TaxID=1294296 RepID=A0A5C6VBF6_9FLAO|nr:Fic family protein [Luteibaculum oceani]TXC81931.1 Fic family protein [Luteibaculum oceani]